MEQEKLRRIFHAFKTSGTFVSAEWLYGGVINESYRITSAEETGYLLQRVRPGIFSNIPDMVRNKEKVSGHIRNKLLKQRIHDITRKYITFFYTYRDTPFYKDHQGDYWTLSLYIRETRTYPTVPSAQIAFEMGAGLGEFENRTCDFDPALLKITLPGFQDPAVLNGRLHEILPTLEADDRKQVEALMARLSPVAKIALKIHQLREEGILPVRVSHNAFSPIDILLDWNDHPLCLTGLDLVMPGVVHYDFGDAVRTVCSPEGEGTFNFPFFENLSRGFMGKCGHLLTRKERETLPDACLTMPYLHALHHLNNYGIGGRFSPTGDPRESLRKAENQVALLEAMAPYRDRIRNTLLAL